MPPFYFLTFAKVSVSVSKTFGLKKKSRYLSRKYLVSKKSLGLGLKNFGIEKKSRYRSRWNFWSRHSVYTDPVPSSTSWYHLQFVIWSGTVSVFPTYRWITHSKLGLVSFIFALGRFETEFFANNKLRQNPFWGGKTTLIQVWIKSGIFCSISIEENISIFKWIAICE